MIIDTSFIPTTSTAKLSTDNANLSTELISVNTSDQNQRISQESTPEKVQTLRERCLACSLDIMKKCCSFWSRKCVIHIRLVLEDMLLGAALATPPALASAFVVANSDKLRTFLLGEGIVIPTSALVNCLASYAIPKKKYQLLGTGLGVTTGVVISAFGLSPVALGSYTVTIILSGAAGSSILGAFDRIIHLRV